MDILEMMKNPEILKTLSIGEKMLGSLIVMVLGIVTCFIVLLIIMFAIRIMGAAVGEKKKPQVPSVAPAPAPAPAASPVVAAPQEDEGELIAVITAAITAMRGSSSFRIRNISEKKAPPALSNWVSAGRIENFSSRRVAK